MMRLDLTSRSSYLLPAANAFANMRKYRGACWSEVLVEGFFYLYSGILLPRFEITVHLPEQQLVLFSQMIGWHLRCFIIDGSLAFSLCFLTVSGCAFCRTVAPDWIFSVSFQSFQLEWSKSTKPHGFRWPCEH